MYFNKIPTCIFKTYDKSHTREIFVPVYKNYYGNEVLLRLHFWIYVCVKNELVSDKIKCIYAVAEALWLHTDSQWDLADHWPISPGNHWALVLPQYLHHFGHVVLALREKKKHIFLETSVRIVWLQIRFRDWWQMIVVEVGSLRLSSQE